MPTAYSDEDVFRQLANRVWRMNNLYWIRTKMEGLEGQEITFRPNKVQKKIYHTIETNPRTIILKPRKLGVTTGIVIYLLDQVLFRQNQICRTIAHRRLTATELFNDIVRYSFEKIDPEFYPKIRYTTRAEIETEKTGSKYSVDVEARGTTPTKLHLSEVAYVEDETNLQDTIESLPTTATGIAESTANGKGNWFHETFTKNWELLQQGRAPQWYPLFFGWYDDPNNRLVKTPDKDYFYPTETLEQGQKFHNMDGSPLSENQLLWWDRKRYELGERLPELYPSSPEEAFIFSTGRVYDSFNRATHVIKPMSFSDYEISMDWGQSNPLVFLCSHQDGDGNFIFFREFYKRNCSYEEMSAWLHKACPEKVDQYGYVHVRYPDPSIFNETQMKAVLRAGDQQEHRSSYAEELLKYKVICYRGVDNSIGPGIGRVKEYMKWDPEHTHPFRLDELGNPVKGSPRIFFTDDMVNTIAEFSNYIWPPDMRGAINASAYEVPRKEHDHAMDAMRYRILNSTKPLIEEKQRDFARGTVGYLLGAEQERREKRSLEGEWWE